MFEQARFKPSTGQVRTGGAEYEILASRPISQRDDRLGFTLIGALAP